MVRGDIAAQGTLTSSSTTLFSKPAMLYFTPSTNSLSGFWHGSAPASPPTTLLAALENVREAHITVFIATADADPTVAPVLCRGEKLLTTYTWSRAGVATTDNVPSRRDAVEADRTIVVVAWEGRVASGATNTGIHVGAEEGVPAITQCCRMEVTINCRDCGNEAEEGRKVKHFQWVKKLLAVGKRD